MSDDDVITLRVEEVGRDGSRAAGYTGPLRITCVGEVHPTRGDLIDVRLAAMTTDRHESMRLALDAAAALSRAVEPADLPPAARPLLLVLRAHLAASGVDPVGEVDGG